jgi:hypothetical protein
LYFLTSRAFHCTTVAVICDIMRTTAMDIVRMDCTVSQISLMVPESSLAKDLCRICLAMLTIWSKVLPFLSVSWWLLEGFDDQGGGRRHDLNLQKRFLMWICPPLPPMTNTALSALRDQRLGLQDMLKTHS